MEGVRGGKEAGVGSKGERVTECNCVDQALFCSPGP